MKPVRQQRVGRGYLDAVLRDANRPYDFRGGLRRLLNIGSSVAVRAAYTYGSIPFNLKYLQHSAYGYGGEWPAISPPVAADPVIHPHPVLQPPPASVSRDDSRYRMKTNFDTGEDRRDLLPAVPVDKYNTPIPRTEDLRINSPASPAQQQMPLDRPNGKVSSERLREGPPPLVTTRSIGGPHHGTRETVSIADTIDGDTAIDRDSDQGRDDAPTRSQPGQMGKFSVRNQLLSRLARQLEAHNFGEQRQDTDRRSGADELQSRTVPSGGVTQLERMASPDQGLPRQNGGRTVRSAANEGSGHRVATNKGATFAEFKKQAAAFHSLSTETPMQEQLRLVSNLQKQATNVQRNPAAKAEAESPSSVPVKTDKKAPVKKAAPVVRHTIVRRSAAPAFWERSYLSHAALRIYK